MTEEPLVCEDCIDDDELRETIKANARPGRCSFCGDRKRRIAVAPIGDVIDHIREAIEEQYDVAANHLPYDYKEGGYQGDYWDTRDLLSEELSFDLPRDLDGRLLDEIVDRLGDDLWCRRDPFALNERDQIRFDWSSFSNLVKHQRRYFFLDSASRNPDHIVSVVAPTTPSKLLSSIFTYAVECGLFIEHASGFMFYRARRQHEDERFMTAEDLGPPPQEYAKQANRMSPAGIVMLYGSDHPDTAIAEIHQGAGSYAVGQFRTKKAVTLLDLSKLPRDRGPFWILPDSAEHDPRPSLRFLHEAVYNISQPIERDDRVHIEYVPTQVVTEYVRFKHLPGGKGVDGIRYPSAVKSGHFSIVLFATQRDVVGTKASLYGLPVFAEPWIELIDRSEQTIPEA